MTTWAPPSIRLLNLSSAPLRSNRLCAMKMPSPMWLAAPVRVEARSVVGDLDRDAGLVPMRRDADLAASELHGVLNQVVEPVHDLRAAADQRLGGCRLAGRGEDQPDARVVVERAGRL